MDDFVTREVVFRLGGFFWEHVMVGGTHGKSAVSVFLIFLWGKSSFFLNINVSMNKFVGYYESSTIFSQSQSRFGVYTLPETKSSLLKMLSGPALFSRAFPASFREGNHPKKWVSQVSLPFLNRHSGDFRLCDL